MNEKVKRVLKGFTSLSDREKHQFIEDLEKLIQGTPNQKETVRKSINEHYARNDTVNFGSRGGALAAGGNITKKSR